MRDLHDQTDHMFVSFAGDSAGEGRADDADAPDGASLLLEGDKLADEGKFTEAVIKYKSGIEKLLPKLRKIPFKHEVKRDVTKRENMKDLILKEIDEDMTPQEFRANELAMKAFGLLPGDYNLREALAQVYSEEVAAFYDPKTKTMHLIEEPKKPVQKKTGLLERLFGKKSDFDKDENKTVIAHELTHALADQHYDLDALQKAVKKDDDRSLALSALIEGEATLAMFGASMDDWEGDISQLARRKPGMDLQLDFSLHGLHGRRSIDPERAPDHQRIDDLSLLPRHGFLRQTDQQGGMGGHR